MLLEAAVGEPEGRGEQSPRGSLSLGPRVGEIILWCLTIGWGESHREEDWELAEVLLILSFHNVSTLRSWLFLMKEAYFVEKMNTFYHLMGSPLGSVSVSVPYRCSRIKFQSTTSRINSNDEVECIHHIPGQRWYRNTIHSIYGCWIVWVSCVVLVQVSVSAANSLPYEFKRCQSKAI